jgi:hypothetical protein
MSIITRVTGVPGINYVMAFTPGATNYVRASSVANPSCPWGYINVLTTAQTAYFFGTIPASGTDSQTFNIASMVTFGVQVLLDYQPLNFCMLLTQAHLITVP